MMFIVTVLSLVSVPQTLSMIDLFLVGFEDAI